MKNLVLFFIFIFLVGCSQKQPIKAQSATIIFKTPLLKFYDKGFVTHYDDYIHLQILNIGKVVLDLEIYENRICQSTFSCLTGKEFNAKYLNKDYKDNFMMNLFKKDKVHFKDKKNNIIIKVRKD